MKPKMRDWFYVGACGDLVVEQYSFVDPVEGGQMYSGIPTLDSLNIIATLL